MGQALWVPYPQHTGVSGTIFIPVLQIRKLRLNQLQEFAQNQIAQSGKDQGEISADTASVVAKFWFSPIDHVYS